MMISKNHLAYLRFYVLPLFTMAIGDPYWGCRLLSLYHYTSPLDFWLGPHLGHRVFPTSGHGEWDFYSQGYDSPPSGTAFTVVLH